jgi:hypothetical protein
MEILVNGQKDIASTEDNVELGDLFDFLRGEFAAQRMAVRGWVLDGGEVFPDEDELLRKRSPAAYKLLEIEVAPFEVIAFDVLRELESNVPELSEKAVGITESYQRGEQAKAAEELRRFIDSVHYVTEAMKTIATLTGIDVSTKMAESGGTENLKKLGEYLAALDSALGESDLATVGDVMEFDIAPSIDTLVKMLALMRSDIEAVVKEKFPDHLTSS